MTIKLLQIMKIVFNTINSHLMNQSKLTVKRTEKA